MAYSRYLRDKARSVGRERRLTLDEGSSNSMTSCCVRADWGSWLDNDGELISLQRKSNSGNLSGRTWRSPYGVLTAMVSDTLWRSRLQAWIDRVQASWSLDSGSSIGA